MCLFQTNQQGQLECLFTSFLFKPVGINDTEMKKPWDHSAQLEPSRSFYQQKYMITITWPHAQAWL